MERFNMLRGLTICLTVGIIFVVSVVVGIILNFPTAIVVFFALLVAFVAQGIRGIPADPPTGAVPQFTGEFIDAFLEAGWTFFPFCGLLFDFSLVDARQINLEIVLDPRQPDNKGLDERTPDNGVVHVEPSFVYKVNAKNPVQFFIAGEREQVERKFTLSVERVLREWISSRKEGPQTWQGARESNGLATDFLIDRLFPNQLEPFPEEKKEGLPAKLKGITVEALMKHFTERPPLYDSNLSKDSKAKDPKGYLEAYRPTDQDKKWQAGLKKLSRDNDLAYKEFEDIIKKRIAQALEAKSGGVEYLLENLGIVVTLVNLGSIDPTGETSKAADRVAMAKLDADAKAAEGDGFRKQIAEMKLVLGDPRAALDAVTIQQGLVKKEVRESQFGVPPDLVEAIKFIASMFKRS